MFFGKCIQCKQKYKECGEDRCQECINTAYKQTKANKINSIIYSYEQNLNRIIEYLDKHPEKVNRIIAHLVLNNDCNTIFNENGDIQFGINTGYW